MSRVRRASGATVAHSATITVARGGQVRLGPSSRIGPRVQIVVGSGGVLELDEGARVGADSRIEVRPHAVVRLGVKAVLGEQTRLVAHERIDIGAAAWLGAEVALFDHEPVIDDPERPIRLQGTVARPIRIGDGATLGRAVTALAGADVGVQAQVAPHAVVDGAVEPGRQVSGVPARADPAPS